VPAAVKEIAFSETETETGPVDIATPLSPFLAGASLSPTQLRQLEQYLDLLLRWNARMNLTAIRDPEQIVTRHFGESLFAARNLYPEPGTRDAHLIDLGSGAGFPGLPIKIWAPDLHVTLLESNQRKSTFLREVVRSLELTAVEVVTTRADQYPIANRETQITNATVTLRAVEHFDDILPSAVNLLSKAGASTRHLALLIGESQIATARRLAPALDWSEPIAIPQSAQRVLLIGHMQ